MLIRWSSRLPATRRTVTASYWRVRTFIGPAASPHSLPKDRGTFNQDVHIIAKNSYDIARFVGYVPKMLPMMYTTAAMAMHVPNRTRRMP
jgi:hypothetical protein